jgi:hypothetical protein
MVLQCFEHKFSVQFDAKYSIDFCFDLRQIEWKLNTLQMHCTENLKHIFTKMKLRAIIPNFFSERFIPTIGSQTQYSKIGGPMVWGIYESLTDT